MTEIQKRNKAVELINLLVPEKQLSNMTDQNFEHLIQDVITILNRDQSYD